MADNPDLELIVGAVADEKSAEKAAKDIVKKVDSSIKGGRIEIPVDVTIPIDETESKLTKAQKDVTTKLSKMMTEGFSASKKDIEDLINKFNEFVKAFDKAGKGRRNNVFREIRKQVEDLQKSYGSTSGSNTTRISRITNTSTNTTNKSSDKDNNLNREINNLNKKIENQTNLDKIENNRQAVKQDEQISELKANTSTNTNIEDATIKDSDTGFNTNAKTEELLKGTFKTNKILGSEIEELLNNIFKNVKSLKDIFDNGNAGRNKNNQKIENQPDLYPIIIPGEGVKSYEDARPATLHDMTDWKKLREKMTAAEIERERSLFETGQHPSQQRSSKVQLSGQIASAVSDNKVFNAIRNVFGKAFGSSEVKRILAMNQEDQEKRRAELVDKYGFSRTDRATMGGDIAQAQRTKSLFNWGGRGRRNINPFEDLKLTEGIGIDTAGITEALQTAIQKNMFTAQTGGTFRNLIGSMTGYIGMPSLEKSRAEAEALNQIMANIRDAVQVLLEDIKADETDLRGLEAKGKAFFNDDGTMDFERSSSEAKLLFENMERRKDSLRSILAEANMVDDVVASIGNNTTKILQNLGFVSPELRKNNIILQNMNAGLDKSGKALKFQSRSGEVLNYSFQLMARSVGQMWKNWMMTLNPINLIKKAFGDFQGYSTKWQRTMNVIKYNIHAILEPFMEKVAQFLVNVLGVVDIISQRVQRVFGVLEPISLFDQSAANAQKMKEELEAASNVTAGFDELHDIGSNNTGANDLMGDIFKPELSEGWKAFADNVAGIFEKVARVIKWCIDNWETFVTLLAGFVIGKGLWDLFKNFLGLSDTVKNLPGLFSNALTAMGFVGGVLLLTVAFKGVWDLGKNWNQMTEEERDAQRKKNNTFGGAGGALLGGTIGFKTGGLTGGLAGGAIGWGVGYGATNLAHTFEAAYNGDKENVKKSAKKAGIGIGEAIGAGIGTAVGGPIGTIVGGGIGAIVGDITGRIGGDVANWFLYNGDYANLKISQEDLKWAIEQTSAAEENQMKTLEELKELEEQTGESGKQLYDAVADGKIKVDDMTSSQLQVYDAYKKHQKAIEETHAAQQQQMDFETSIDLDRAKKTDNYKGYIQKMMQANEEGIYSAEEMKDRFAQEYAKLDNESRKTFMESLPEEVRDGVEEASKQYESGFRKFKTKASQLLKEFFEPMKNAFTEFGGYMWDALTSVGNAITGQGLQSNKEKNQKKQNQKEAEINAEVARYRSKTIGPDPTLTEEEKDKLAEEYRKDLMKTIKSYAVGTNFVPNDGLAYLHQGEAVIPKKYNQPYQPTDTSGLESAINVLTARVTEIGNQVNQGINITGEFKQKGSDLVAVVQKGQNRNGNQALSNPAYAR